MIPYISLITFYRIWKCDYAHIKVSRTVEDICKQCFRFAKKHKCLANHGTNSPAFLQVDSSAKDSIFQPPAKDADKLDPESTGLEPEAIDCVKPRKIGVSGDVEAIVLQLRNGEKVCNATLENPHFKT